MQIKILKKTINFVFKYYRKSLTDNIQNAENLLVHDDTSLLFEHIFLDEEIQLYPCYNVPTEQTLLNKQMISFVNLKNCNLESSLQLSKIIEGERSYNGWNFIWGHFISLEKDEELNAIKTAIAEWDGSLLSLNELTLPVILSRKFHFKNLEILLAQYKNRQAWFGSFFQKNTFKSRFKIPFQTTNFCQLEVGLLRSFTKNFNNFNRKNTQCSDKIFSQLNVLEKKIKRKKLLKKGKKTQDVQNVLNQSIKRRDKSRKI